MKYKITLFELDRNLFPECYPYFNAHFQEERKYIEMLNEYDKISYQNISFKIKVVRYCCAVRDESLRFILRNLLEKHIEKYFGWHKEYDWFELKSILMFFVVFSKIQNINELQHIFNHKPIPILFGKYTPKHNVEQEIQQGDLSTLWV
jgi:hypothetical protein